MQNFILSLILSFAVISINQKSDEEGLDLFIKKYQDKEEARRKESLGTFLVDKFKEYSQDEIINYNDYAE